MNKPKFFKFIKETWETFCFIEDRNAIERKLKKLGICNYNIHRDLTVDVLESVNLEGKGLKKIPFKFGFVAGDFKISKNKLTSLIGCPYEVGKMFACDNNKLTSLNYGPKKVGTYYVCGENPLESLISPLEELGEILNYQYLKSNHKIANFEDYHYQGTMVIDLDNINNRNKAIVLSTKLNEKLPHKNTINKRNKI